MRSVMQLVFITNKREETGTITSRSTGTTSLRVWRHLRPKFSNLVPLHFFALGFSHIVNFLVLTTNRTVALAPESKS